MKLLIISLLALLFFSCCNDNMTTPNKSYGIEIVEPENNFILGAMKEKVIRFRIDDEDEIDKITVYRCYPLEADTFFKELLNEPYLDTLKAGEVICTDSIKIKLYAHAFYKDGKKSLSNTVTGILSNEILSNNLLNKFEYKGYDWDSNLVAEGLIYIDYDPNRHFKIGGRRDINYVQGDSVYEVGTGNFVTSGFGSNNEFELDLTYCTSSIHEPKLYITGIWNDTLIIGDRFTRWIFDPPIKVYLGKFTAIKK